MGAVLARLGLSRRAAVFELSSRGALCRYLLRTFARVTSPARTRTLEALAERAASPRITAVNTYPPGGSCSWKRPSSSLTVLA